MADGTKRVHSFSRDIRKLDWLAKTIWDPTFSGVKLLILNTQPIGADAGPDKFSPFPIEQR